MCSQLFISILQKDRKNCKKEEWISTLKNSTRSKSTVKSKKLKSKDGEEEEEEEEEKEEDNSDNSEDNTADDSHNRKKYVILTHIIFVCLIIGIYLFISKEKTPQREK